MDSIRRSKIEEDQKSGFGSKIDKERNHKRIATFKKGISEHKLISIITLILILAGCFGIKQYFFPSTDYSSYQPIPTDSPSSTDQPTDAPNDTLNSSDQTSFSPQTPIPTSTPSPSPTPSPTPCTTSSAADSGHSSLSANPTSANADGSSQITIIVTVKDSCGNILSGAVIDLLTSDSSAVFHPSNQGSNITDSSGQAAFIMTSTNTGNDQINVQSQLNGTTVIMNNLGNVTFNAISPTSTALPTPSPST